MDRFEDFDARVDGVDFRELLATSTVRFTGRDRVVLLRDELPAVDLDGDVVLGAEDRFEEDEALDDRVGLCEGADCLLDRDRLEETDFLGAEVLFGAGVDLDAFDDLDDRACCVALGADLVCELFADFELDPFLLLRPNAGTISNEIRNTIVVMRTICLLFRMSSLLSLTAEPAFAFFHAPFSFSLVSQSCFASENS
ncbi:MAG: hypothetical protein ACYSUG_05060 [Planctomycetota bacterium]